MRVMLLFLAACLPACGFDLSALKGGGGPADASTDAPRLDAPTFVDGPLSDASEDAPGSGDGGDVDAGPVIEPGLAAYWRFDDDPRARLAWDATGNGNHGMLVGAAGWTTGPCGGAIQLLGDSYVDVGDRLNHVTGPFSVAAWIYVETTTYGTVVTSDASPDRYEGFFVFRSAATSAWGVTYGDGRAVSSCCRRTKNTVMRPLPAETWVHIVAVVEGPTNMRLYAEGVEVDSAVYDGIGGPMVRTANPLHIGPWGGRLDDLRIYDRALSASEVAEIAARCR